MSVLQQLFAALAGSRPSPSPGRSRPSRRKPKRNNRGSGRSGRRQGGAVHAPIFGGQSTSSKKNRKTRPRRSSATSRSSKPTGKKKSKGQQRPASNSRSWVLYHGTSSAASAKGIINRGFFVGPGNAAGDGVYFARDVATAKTYAGSSGCYLKVRINHGRACTMNPKLQADYAAWCKRHGVTPDNSALTAFLLHRKFQTLVNGNVVVLLRPQTVNAVAYAKKDRRVHILGVYRAADDKRIRV